MKSMGSPLLSLAMVITVCAVPPSVAVAESEPLVPKLYLWNHEKATRDALEGVFSETALQKMVACNKATDDKDRADVQEHCPEYLGVIDEDLDTVGMAPYYVSKFHFDSEQLRGGSDRLIAYKEKAILALTDEVPNPVLAWVYLGAALHTLQDFYAHSNWIETHPLQSPEAVVPVLASLGNARLENPSPDTPFCEHSDWYWAPGSQMYRIDTWIDVSIDGTAITTGYWFGGNSGCPTNDDELQIVIAKHKCLHGLVCGGIAKDGDDYLDVERRATWNFIAQVLNDPRISGDVPAQQLLFGRQVDIIETIDRSGSMAGAFLSAAKSTAKNFVTLAATDDQIGVVSFDTASRVEASPLVIAGDAERGALMQAIDRISVGGATSIGAGLRTAGLELLPLIGHGRLGVPGAILLLSDGGENTAPWVGEACTYMPLPGLCHSWDELPSGRYFQYIDGRWDLGVLQEIKLQGPKVYTIALGSGSDQYLLDYIARNTGGRYYLSPGTSGMAEHLQRHPRRLEQGTEGNVVHLERDPGIYGRGG